MTESNLVYIRKYVSLYSYERLVRKAAMLALSWWSYFCPSVCPSVTRVLCDRSKAHRPTAGIFIPYEMVIILVFCDQQMLMGGVPFHLKFALKVTHPLQKRRLRSISAYNVSTVRASKKVQVSWIGSRPCAFHWAIDEVRMLSLTPPMGGSKSKFVFFVNKIKV